jgi:hypothetical protein
VSLRPLVEAFRSAGLDEPLFFGGEDQAARGLLRHFKPAEIAKVWQRIEIEGDHWERKALSFSMLARQNRVRNWLKEPSRGDSAVATGQYARAFRRFGRAADGSLTTVRGDDVGEAGSGTRSAVALGEYARRMRRPLRTPGGAGGAGAGPGDGGADAHVPPRLEDDPDAYIDYMRCDAIRRLRQGPPAVEPLGDQRAGDGSTDAHSTATG